METSAKGPWTTNATRSEGHDEPQAPRVRGPRGANGSRILIVEVAPRRRMVVMILLMAMVMLMRARRRMGIRRWRRRRRDETVRGGDGRNEERSKR